MGCVCELGSTRFSSVFGLGVYHVASRAVVAGGTSLGLHAGARRDLLRSQHLTVVADARVLVLTKVLGSPIWFFPVGLSLRVR